MRRVLVLSVLSLLASGACGGDAFQSSGAAPGGTSSASGAAGTSGASLGAGSGGAGADASGGMSGSSGQPDVGGGGSDAGAGGEAAGHGGAITAGASGKISGGASGNAGKGGSGGAVVTSGGAGSGGTGGFAAGSGGAPCPTPGDTCGDDQCDGTAMDMCGHVVACPNTCPDASICDPNTHACVACKSATAIAAVDTVICCSPGAMDCTTQKTSYGSAHDLDVGVDLGSHALLRFSLPVVGAAIAAAKPGEVTLTLTLTRSGLCTTNKCQGGTITAYALSDDWEEATATWRLRKAAPANSTWIAPGADDPGDRSTTGVTVTVDDSSPTLDITFDATLFAGRVNNLSISILLVPSDGAIFDFISRESSGTAPMLTTNVCVPKP